MRVHRILLMGIPIAFSITVHFDVYIEQMLDGIVFEFLLGAVLLKARRDQAKLKAGLRLRTKLNN